MSDDRLPGAPRAPSVPYVPGAPRPPSALGSPSAPSAPSPQGAPRAPSTVQPPPAPSAPRVLGAPQAPVRTPEPEPDADLRQDVTQGLVRSPDMIAAGIGDDVDALTMPPDTGFMQQELGEDEGFFTREWEWVKGAFGPEEVEPTLPTRHIDVGQMRRQLRRYKARTALERERSSRGRDLTAEEEEAILTRVTNEAHDEIRRMIDLHDNASVVFVDTDPEGTTERIATMPSLLGINRVVTAYLTPYSHTTYTPVVERVAGPDGQILRETRLEAGEIYNRQGAWGWLNWLGQGAPSAALATAARAGNIIEAEQEAETGEDVGWDIPFVSVIDDIIRGFGTEEHIASIRRGEEMMSFTEKIGESAEVDILDPGLKPGLRFGARMLGYDEKQAEDLANTLMGVGVSLAIALVEPDVFFFSTMLTGGLLGAAVNAGRRAATLPRLLNTKQDLLSGADELATIRRQAEEAAIAGREARAMPSPDEVPDLGRLPGDTAAPRQAEVADAAKVAAGEETASVPLTTAGGRFAELADAAVLRVLDKLSPEVRSSVSSHVALMTGWAPLLEEKVRRALQAASAAETRVDALRTRYIDRIVETSGEAVEALGAEARIAADASEETRRAFVKGLRDPERPTYGSGALFERIAPRKGRNRFSGRARTKMAFAEWAAVSQRHIADELLLAEMKAQRELLGRMVETAKPPRLTPEAQQTLADNARASWLDAQKARKAFFEASTQAEAAAAERAFLKAQQTFMRASGEAVQSMGAAGLKAFDEALAVVEASQKASKSAVTNLSRRITKAQNEGTVGRSRVGFKFALHGERELVEHLKNVAKLTESTSPRNIVRGRNLLHIVEKSLRDHAASYNALHNAVASGNTARTASASDIRDAMIGVLSDAQLSGEAAVTATEARRLLKVLKDVVGPDVLARTDDPLVAHLKELTALTTTRGTRGEAFQVQRGELSSIQIPPNALRNTARRLASEYEVVRDMGTALAAAGEIRRPWMGYMLSSYNTNAAQEAMHRTYLTVQRVFATLSRPSSDVLGPASKAIEQIGKGALDAQRFGLVEITRLFNDASSYARKTGVSQSRAVKEASIRFCDGAAAKVDYEMGFESVLTGTHQGTLWEQARAFLLQMADAGESTKGMEALATMWFPSGVDMQIWASRLTGEMLRIAAETENVMEFRRVLAKEGTLFDDRAEAENAWLVARSMGNVEFYLRESSTFADFAYKMRQATARVLRDGSADKRAMELLTGEVTRAYGFATQAVMQSAVAHKMTQQMAGAVAGFSPEAMSAAAKVTEGFDAMAGGHYTEAMALLNRMGLPTKMRTLANDSMEDMRAGLIMLQKADSEEAVLIPRLWMSALDDQLGNIVKSTEEFAAQSTDGVAGMLRHTAGRYMKLWRMSVTTGLLWHSPRYLTAMMAGNLSQILADPVGGVGAAARSAAMLGAEAAKKLGTYEKSMGIFSPLRMLAYPGQNVPWFRRSLDRIHDAMIAKFGEERALPSPLASLYNNHVSNFFDSAQVGADATIRTSKGDYVTMGFLREQALKQGVLSSYASNELMDLLARTASVSYDRDIYAPLGLARAVAEGAAEGGARGALAAAGRGVRERAGAIVSGPLKYLERRGSIIADFADSIEQRQRAALFLDHIINRGMSPEEAGKLVRESLFDWGHAMSRFEAEHINQYMLFYRFHKLMLRQGGRILGDGFIRGFRGGDEAREALEKLTSAQTATGRLRFMQQAGEGAREVAGYDMDQLAEDDEFAWCMSKLYPWWSRSRATPFLTNMPQNEAEVAMWRMRYGKDVTHTARALPNLTPFDSVALLTSLMGAVARIGTGNQTPSAAAGNFIVELADRSGPFMSEALKGVANGLFGAESGAQWGRPPTLRPAERFLLGGADAVSRTVGLDRFLSPFVFRLDDDLPGTARANRGLITIMRLLPVIGSEVPYWLDPVITAGDVARARSGEDASSAEVIRRELTYLATQYSGILKEYAHNPRASREREMETLQRRMNKRINSLNTRRYLSYAEGYDYMGRRIDED